MKKNNIKVILKNFFIIILIVAVLFIMLFLGIGVLAFFTKTDITNIPKSISINITGTSVVSEESDSILDELCWYDTFDEAIKDDSLIREVLGYEEIYLRENTVRITKTQIDDNLIVFYMPAYTKEEKEQQDAGEYVGVFLCMQLKIKDGKISQPYNITRYARDLNYPEVSVFKARYTYDCDDSIVRGIEKKIMMDLLIAPELYVPIYCGTWQNKEEIESLTINGEHLKIYPVQSGEDIYYLWYIDDIQEINAELGQINWGDFTYGEIIEVLDIRYEKSEETEKH